MAWLKALASLALFAFYIETAEVDLGNLYHVILVCNQVAMCGKCLIFPHFRLIDMEIDLRSKLFQLILTKMIGNKDLEFSLMSGDSFV